MRILWLTVDRSHRVAHHFDDFRETVKLFSDLEILTKRPAGDLGQDMWQLSRNLISGETTTENILAGKLEKDSNFDFIFTDAFFAYLNEDWKSVDIPTGIFIEDVHQQVPKHQIKKAKEFKIKNIFYRFNEGFHRFHPKARFEFNCFWLPHSIKMERFSDKIKKSIDVLHVGVAPQQYYPNRYAAIQALRSKPYFKLVNRPKDTPGTDRNKKWPVDRDYDNLLQSAWIAITGGSVFNAPVQKYVEIPASGAVLMSNWFPDLGMLGFKPWHNMVAYHQENVVSVVEEALSNKSRLEEISDNALHLIKNRHTSEVRAQQFINMICKILGKPLEFPQVEFPGDHVNFRSKLQDGVPSIPNKCLTPKSRNAAR